MQSSVSANMKPILFVVTFAIQDVVWRVPCYRRIYWSDCSAPATIQTASVDGGDPQILISDNQHSCIRDIAIDFDSKRTYYISHKKTQS